MHLFLSDRFNSFSLEASSTCRYDYVAVYDGENTLAPLMGKFCGSELPPNLRSSSKHLFLQFATDSSVAAEGWRATYSETLGSVSPSHTSAMSLLAIHYLHRQHPTLLTIKVLYWHAWFGSKRKLWHLWHLVNVNLHYIIIHYIINIMHILFIYTMSL